MLTLDFPEGVNRDIVGGKKKKKLLEEWRWKEMPLVSTDRWQVLCCYLFSIFSVRHCPGYPEKSLTGTFHCSSKKMLIPF